MRVFIYLNELARHFGPGIQAVLLATELERRGVSVVVFVEQGVASGNQYLSMLRSRGVRVVVPGLWALRIARYPSLPRLVLTLLIPLRLLLTVLDMLTSTVHETVLAGSSPTEPIFTGFGADL